MKLIRTTYLPIEILSFKTELKNFENYIMNVR